MHGDGPAGRYRCTVAFEDVGVGDPRAHALLTEYFAYRASSFPAGREYRTAFPAEPDFAPPRGVFVLALDAAGTPVGCGGVRLLGVGQDGGIVFEIKHLWLQPHTRGQGLGRAMLEHLEQRALGFGASMVVLDTNASLEAANALYRAAGYFEIDAYNDNPNATNWYAKRLR